MEANSIADEKKVAVFLSVIGANSFKLLKSLLSNTCSSREKNFGRAYSGITKSFFPKGNCRTVQVLP